MINYNTSCEDIQHKRLLITCNMRRTRTGEILRTTADRPLSGMQHRTGEVRGGDDLIGYHLSVYVRVPRAVASG